MTSLFLLMTSPIKFYHVTQIILQMWSCDQSLVTIAISMREVILKLTLGMALNFYTSVEKALKLKVRKFWGLIPTFAEVTGEKLVEGGGELFAPHPE